MKKTLIYMAAAAAMTSSLTACSDMMSPESDSYLYDSDLTLNQPSDSLYSIVGLMTKVQQLGERYVLFGEVRGDLMTVAPTADAGLQEMAAFEPLTDDTYLNRADFYAVINHCNWILSKMDPTVKLGTEAVLEDEYAAAVLYRAWAYLQLGLAYGTVSWVTEPVLSLEGAISSCPQIGLDELVGKLITEVEPVARMPRVNYGTLDGRNSAEFFLIPSLFLADLYLYDGRYDQAADMYWYTADRYGYTVTDNPIHFSYNNTQRMSLQTSNFNTTYGSERCVAIPYSTLAKDYHTNLINLTINEKPSLLPAAWWVDEMADKTYYFGRSNYVSSSFTRSERSGDLRAAVRYGDDTWHNGGSVGFWRTGNGMPQERMIAKFYNNATVFNGSMTENTVAGVPCSVCNLAIARTPHLYLRYAEAVNRLGKPSLAYSVLRYGLNRETLSDTLRVNPQELESGEEWLNWNDSKFNGNTGTMMRGRGYGVKYPAATELNLPTDLTEQELMLWVEDRIVEEMAAETAFEGNRFFDLVRVAHHRNDPSWFAERVSRRFADPAAAKAKLSNRENWFIR